jgi:Flagellar motor switch/type III secretory pathway protein
MSDINMDHLTEEQVEQLMAASEEEVERILNSAAAAEAAGQAGDTAPDAAKTEPSREARKVEFDSLTPQAMPDPEAKDIRGSVLGIPVKIDVVIGTVHMSVNEVLSLRRGVVVDLDKLVEQPADIMANGKLLARGELVIHDGDKLGITLTEVIKGDQA